MKLFQKFKKKRNAKKIAKSEEFEKIAELIREKDPWEGIKYLKELSKTRKIEKIREIRKKIEKLRERDPIIDIELSIKWCKIVWYGLKRNPNAYTKPTEDLLKLSYRKLKELYIENNISLIKEVHDGFPEVSKNLDLSIEELEKAVENYKNQVLAKKEPNLFL